MCKVRYWGVFAFTGPIGGRSRLRYGVFVSAALKPVSSFSGPRHTTLSMLLLECSWWCFSIPGGQRARTRWRGYLISCPSLQVSTCSISLNRASAMCESRSSLWRLSMLIWLIGVRSIIPCPSLDEIVVFRDSAEYRHWRFFIVFGVERNRQRIGIAMDDGFPSVEVPFLGNVGRVEALNWCAVVFPMNSTAWVLTTEGVWRRLMGIVVGNKFSDIVLFNLTDVIELKAVDLHLFLFAGHYIEGVMTSNGGWANRNGRDVQGYWLWLLRVVDMVIGTECRPRYDVWRDRTT